MTRRIKINNVQEYIENEFRKKYGFNSTPPEKRKARIKEIEMLFKNKAVRYDNEQNLKAELQWHKAALEELEEDEKRFFKEYRSLSSVEKAALANGATMAEINNSKSAAKFEAFKEGLTASERGLIDSGVVTAEDLYKTQTGTDVPAVGGVPQHLADEIAAAFAPTVESEG